MLVPVQSGTRCFGRADPVRHSRVTGWFIAEREQPVIAALVDGEPAGTAVISGSPVDAAPEGARGFAFPIPRRYQDGRSHILVLALDNASPIDFLAANGTTMRHLRFRFASPDRATSGAADDDIAPGAEEPGPPFTGRADPFAGTMVTGWAASIADPEIPVRLSIVIDRQPAGSVLCDRPSSTARALGLPGETGGFTYAIPERFLDGTTHSLSILFSDGSSLNFDDGGAGPLHFTAEPASTIEGDVDGLAGDTLRGWAVRRHRASGAIAGALSIQVLCNGVMVGEVVADQPRVDVSGELRCDPHIGFQVRLPNECRNGQEFAFSFRVLPEGQDLPGSPLAVRYHQVDADRELRALAATLDELCTSAFKLQQQIRELLPATNATVANYDAWARRYQAQLRSRMAAAEALPNEIPLVSVIMPVYRPNLAHLTAAIESVRRQTYGNWELIIVDDGSNSPAVAGCVRNYAAEDERITCLFNRKNRGISAATNAALRKAKGAYVALFDHDDLLVEAALEAMVREVLRTGARLLYSDEDEVDEFGVFSEPNLKPDWNYRLLLSVNYVRHLVMVDRSLLRRVGQLRLEYDGARDHDLLLRLSERCSPGQILHVPEILYHGRKNTGSTADFGEAKPYATAAGCRAIADHLARRGFSDCQVTSLGGTTNYAVSWGLRIQPSVSVIVPFRDQVAMTRRCLDALLSCTDWKDWTVILVDNGSVTKEAVAFCHEAAANPHVVVHRIDEPFNFARLNNLASRVRPADFHLFLNNDVIIAQPDWLRVMIDEALADPAVAIVGAKLVYPNGTVQHGGVVLGVGSVADHAFKGIPAANPGYMSRARCAQQYSAVTAACMLCRADAFVEVGGFDEHELAVAFNDVDLCLKVGSRGWKVIWTPAVVAEHHESLSRGDDMAPGKAARFFRESHVMFQRWHHLLDADPFYNRHFSRERGVFFDLR